MFYTVTFKGDGLSEKQILRLVKNRISAITCMANNPLNLIRISKKYHISKQLIMKDYFGFTETSTDVEQEPIDEEGFVSKQAAAIVRDLDHVSQVVNNGLVAHEEEYETVPRALVALKFRIPMVFVIKLGDYFAHKPADLVADEESSAFYRRLLDLKRQLAQHRHDLKKLCEVLDGKLPPGDVDVNLPKLEKLDTSESQIVQVIKEEDESQTTAIVNQI